MAAWGADCTKFCGLRNEGVLTLLADSAGTGTKALFKVDPEQKPSEGVDRPIR